MNKTAIKNFAVWARKKLISDITYRAGLIGVTEKGIAEPLAHSTLDTQFFDIGTKDYVQVSRKEIEQRNALIRAIKEKEVTSDYKTAYNYIIEEVAYTWFNRLIAIRFMEVNDYLPSRIRVLSSENPDKNEPDFVTTPFDTDMEFTEAEQERIMQLKDENKLDELFRILFIKQCNKLHEILPELFEETNNYTELLLSISFTDKDGIVNNLVHDIAEDDFNIEKEGQVEIIGWMYQYYNIEPKDETFALLKKNIKISKERIPAATQLFTPDWIVRYMVENSLGRLWVEGHPNEDLERTWTYYLKEAEQEEDVRMQLEQIRVEHRDLNPEDIKVIDPCMGSGHILVYCFDVLMQIYESQGYTQRDAAQSILENNLFGLDIDNRAAQLAYFSVMMKARQYDRRIFTREIKPRVYAIEESNNINRVQLKYFGADLCTIEKNQAKLQMENLLDTMIDAKEYGSILNVENYDWDLLMRFVASLGDAGQMSLDTIGIDQTQNVLFEIIEIARIMAQKYEVVITNPPYMGASGMSSKLSQFVKDNYPDSKADLFACCIEKGNCMTTRNGFNCMVTMQSWMFLSSFEKMRIQALASKTITNLMHMENMVMGIAFGTAVTVFRNSAVSGYKGTYNHITMADIINGQPKEFPVQGNRYAQVSTANFSKIPGAPVAYWVHKSFFEIFENPTIETYGSTSKGIITGDNSRFLRLWHEVRRESINFKAESYVDSEESNLKWYPCNKGGEFRRWYGNNHYIINWMHNGDEVMQRGRVKVRNCQDYSNENKFIPSITWTSLSSGKPSFRYSENALSESAGMTLFVNQKYLQYCIGFLNSKPADYLLKVLNPTLNYTAGSIASLPLIFSGNLNVERLSAEAINLERQDWDAFETSWNFEVHPLLSVISNNRILFDDINNIDLAECFMCWENECNERFDKLKSNEEELNRIFIDIYGLQNELTPEVDDKDITVRKADLGRDIRSLVSYAVGCMFGRYSLNEPGLVYAGGKWDTSKYSTFIPNIDNCILVTDEVYSRENDIVELFCDWVKTVFGAKSLDTNLAFIADALGNKGSNPKEVIRNYFLNDFMKDHIKIYQKRPIYWLFDSGKQNGFKALAYMHRWSADTVGNLRVEYLHKIQRIYESEIQRMQDVISNSQDSKDVTRATKRKDKLQKQLKESRDYDAKLAHIALSRKEIDLDDGVKFNYEEVQKDRDGNFHQILAKI